MPHSNETARALEAARAALADGRPDDPVEISALSLCRLGHSVVQLHGELESVAIDLDEARRQLAAPVSLPAAVADGSTVNLTIELTLLHRVLARLGDEEWSAVDRVVHLVGAGGERVGVARSEVVAQYIACLDPSFVRGLLIEVATLRERTKSVLTSDGKG